MGTSLTGTKPKDTYDSLIKVGDNGPISGTAKYLSDGLGNDLPIAVSTSNVGIGTSAPTSALEIGSGLDFKLSTTGTFILGSSSQAIYKSSGADAISFNANAAERFRITANGVTFNGDTAAANALDDYEEGIWSPQVYYQNATDQANATNVTQVGTYTKIGRQVTLCGVLQWTITGSPAVDNVGIKNFPFAAQNSADYFSFGQLQLINADSYPAATLDIFVNQNASVCIIATPAGLSNQGANIGATGTKTARFTITYFV